MTTNWFWLATFTDGSTVTFYAESKDLAWDHAGALARDFKRIAKTVKRLKHANDVSKAEYATAGELIAPR